ncbi:MAG TPA: hypothetical protein VEJ63_08955 [Planctomycetota bacterium]|nr:hypothetical protein [Planctomycetota bacterium]
MHLQDTDLARALALEAEALERRRGITGRTKVRPAARIGQPYDILELNFAPQTLTLAPAGSTQYASSAEITLPTQVPLASYSLLVPDVLAFEVDDASLGGAFVSFLNLKLDDDTLVALNGTQMICSAPGGQVSINGPTLNDVVSIGVTRKIKAAKVMLQADSPGTATASLPVGQVQMWMFRSRLGRTISAP